MKRFRPAMPGANASAFPFLACAVALSSMPLCAVADEPKSLAPVEVVGTRLKRTDLETPVPVQIIGIEEIRRSGANSLIELLSRIPAAGTGGLRDLDAGSGFSPGAASASLRGLGSHATLILLDGRRITASPYADPNTGQSQLYNLNSIPLALVERVEILKGGASAIYGSDAIAGVINIILRKEFRGGEAGIRYDTSEGGVFGNRQIHAAAGFGDPGKDGYNGILLFANGKRDATTVPETRNVAESDLARFAARNTHVGNTASYPGNYFRERVVGNGAFNVLVGRDARCPADQVLANGQCGYNPDQLRDTVGAQDSNSLFGRINFPASGNVSLFTEFGLSSQKNRYTRIAQGVSNTGATWFAQDGRRNFFQFVLPAGHPDNPDSVPVSVRYRFADAGPNLVTVSSDTARLMLGAKGRFEEWDWESALLYMGIRRDTRDRGYLHAASLRDAINTLAYRPYGNNSEQTIAAIRPEIRDTGKASSTSWDLRGTRELMTLDGGPLAMAAGVEARHETLEVSPDLRTVNGEFINRGATEAYGSRNVASLYAELIAPFTPTIETQLALRHDRYSDYGTSTTPQAGFKWKPVHALALRGSYARGFRAPSLSTSGSSNVQSVTSGVRDPLRCGAAGGTAADCNVVVSSLIRANPDLQPERSDGQTLGLVFSPTPAFDMAIDFYRISRTNEIDRVESQFVIANEARYPGTVIRDPNPATWLPGVPNSGPIQSTVRQFFNLGRTDTRGVDVDATLRSGLGGWGKLVTQFQGSYLIGFKNRQLETAPAIEYRGGYGAAGEFPRFRGSIATTWTVGHYALTGRINHVGGWRVGDSVTDCHFPDPAYIAHTNCRVKAWTTLDVQLRYAGIKNLELGSGIRNVQNKAAPLDAAYFSSGFNPTVHNPYGRTFSLWLNYRFL